MKSHIVVDLVTSQQTFTDWFDFADYLKQQTLAGKVVTVKGWEYIQPVAYPPFLQP